MAYTICISKTAPCTTQPFSAPPGSSSGVARTLEVYGCTSDLTQYTKDSGTVQGTFTPTGCCCAWTVPSGVKSITVEMWGAGGGGGSGASANCCGSGPGAGAGTYFSGILPVVPGDIMTICAGGGGCNGSGYEGIETYCCCGPRGNCSFISRNGNMCMDSHGGGFGFSDCYIYCGCTWKSCGNISTWTGSCGCNDGCMSVNSGQQILAGPSVAISLNCQGNCHNQRSMSSGAAFGGDQRWFGYSCNCWNYMRWNTGCTNTAGIVGPGGDPGPTGCAYNSPGTANYACATTEWANCPRTMQSPPGNFPGGGGTSGVTTACCYRHSGGGAGGAGYVRIYY